jgi:octopine/nopaline transport system substrate-binding protein
MKKLRLVFMTLAAALFAGQSIAGDWSKIRIATEGAYAPWNFTDSSGKLVGFELDLAADLCKRMNAQCEIVAQAWDGIIPALQAGKYDAIMAGMSITDKRKKVITFSRDYAATPARFVVSDKSPMANFKTDVEDMNLTVIDPKEKAAITDIVAEFKGKTVGVQTATTHENFLREYLGENVTIRTYDTQENLDLDLQAGRVDTALASMSYWVPLFESDKGKGMKMVGPGMTGGPFGSGVGVGIRQKDQDLADMFTKAINEAIADGTISKLAIKWFGFDASSKPS